MDKGTSHTLQSGETPALKNTNVLSRAFQYQIGAKNLASSFPAAIVDQMEPEAFRHFLGDLAHQPRFYDYIHNAPIPIDHLIQLLTNRLKTISLSEGTKADDVPAQEEMTINGNPYERFDRAYLSLTNKAIDECGQALARQLDLESLPVGLQENIKQLDEEIGDYRMAVQTTYDFYQKLSPDDEEDRIIMLNQLNDIIHKRLPKGDKASRTFYRDCLHRLDKTTAAIVVMMGKIDKDLRGVLDFKIKGSDESIAVQKDSKFLPRLFALQYSDDDLLNYKKYPALFYAFKKFPDRMNGRPETGIFGKVMTDIKKTPGLHVPEIAEILNLTLDGLRVSFVQNAANVVTRKQISEPTTVPDVELMKTEPSLPIIHYPEPKRFMEFIQNERVFAIVKALRLSDPFVYRTVRTYLEECRDQALGYLNGNALGNKEDTLKLDN